MILSYVINSNIDIVVDITVLWPAYMLDGREGCGDVIG